MLEITKLLKSQVCISKITGRAPLSGVFINSRFIDKALKVLKEESNSNKIIKVARLIRTVLHTRQVQVTVQGSAVKLTNQDFLSLGQKIAISSAKGGK